MATLYKGDHLHKNIAKEDHQAINAINLVQSRCKL
jgi:hypothetical protein